ncbi:DNA-directed RNA polymerase subunit omega [Edaphobacter sp. 12200R-103]|uniref:DNA-directed RNA polymerase subunit omega n=1 Tax=Edaphobacter sp. 12200R-103 TaxID=2703788 RepID=UPI00138B4440|nr:DNA-directed RNA polymerase subunit omega [Edaphobacter sp. 12200R-103]QHS52887.1 DNA-directed RNA polymerase subunit omega [Edaphobacter sp. 12200R-103]
MRSEAIFRAKEAVSNRYQLCQTVAKATRRMHVASRNQQDTINSALEKVAGDAPLVAVKRVVL